MRILDVNDKELQEINLNLELGYTKPEKKFLKHHDAVVEKKEKKHYKVKTFYFEDNTSMNIVDEKDSHVKIIDDQQGIFNFVLLGKDLEDPKQLEQYPKDLLVYQENLRKYENHEISIKPIEPIVPKGWKVFRGADIEEIIDIKGEEAKDAYDEYEDILRYTLYTAEELAKRKLEKEKVDKQTVFFETGPNRLDATEVTLNDLTLMVSEVVGK